MQRLIGIWFFCLLFHVARSQPADTVKINDRAFWLSQLDKVARPVMLNLSLDQLKQKIPGIISISTDNAALRSKFAMPEAFARTLSGIAPWLNIEDGSAEEIVLRNQYREWSLKAIENAVDPSANDYMTWDQGSQPLVDASFLALALIRCPWLWDNLDEKDKKNVVFALLKTRAIVPAYTNWILFSGMIEAFFCRYGFDYDKVRIEFAIREFANHWYVGDGMFSDGNNFALDYYNSIVIQPFLSVIVSVANAKTGLYNEWRLRIIYNPSMAAGLSMVNKSRVNNPLFAIQDSSFFPNFALPI